MTRIATLCILSLAACRNAPVEPWDAGTGTRDASVDAPFMDDADAGRDTDIGPPPDESCELEGLPDLSSGTRVATVDIVNDTESERSCEVALGSFAIRADAGITDLSRLALAAAGEPIPAQFMALSRWDAGPDNLDAPLQWVQVAARVSLGPDQTGVFDVIRLDEPVEVDGVRLEGDVVDTGTARITLDRGGDLIASIERAGETIVDDAGIRFEWEGATYEGASVVADGPLDVLERGPLLVVVAQRGHLVAPGTGCTVGTDAGPETYESLGYTLVATFEHGSADVALEFHVRNECGSGSAPFDDEAQTVDGVEFFVQTRLAGEVIAAADGVLNASANRASVSQHVGGGSPWRRRASAAAGEERQELEAVQAAMVGVRGSGQLATVQMPFMQHREPQALVVDSGRLSARLISEPLRVGEATGIWGSARFQFRGDTNIDRVREAGHRRLERGLLVRMRGLDSTEVLSPLGDGASSTQVAREYRAILDGLMRSTTGAQWERFKVHGSQLWPDVPFEDLGDSDPSRGVGSPEELDAKMNYWNASGVPLMEFLRTGEPSFAWDLGLPGSWLQAHASLYNVGDHTHTSFNGVAVSSGGTGIGGWHRGSGGSDDYTYAAGLPYAYLIRPNRGLLDRFAAAGATLAQRYGIPKARESEREVFFTARGVTRQTVQHYDMLANCAQFVPGSAGDACRSMLHEIVAELYEDNLSAGSICAADTPAGTQCSTPQQFMVNALMVGFFVRYARTWPDRLPDLGDALQRIGENYARFGITSAGGTNFDVDGEDTFAARFECELDAGRTRTLNCSPAPDSDSREYMYRETRAHTLAFLAQTRALGSANCEGLADAFDSASLYDAMRGWAPEGGGFWKGAAMMMQGMVHGVGAAERCR